MELLGFLRTTMTAQEIADALHLSLATVKTHQRTLYRKLGVNSRRGALRATQHHRVSALER
jgi:LuxR family maltose regulon positive regulatory protein